MRKISFPTLESARMIGIGWGEKNKKIYHPDNDFRHTGYDLYHSSDETPIYSVADGVVVWADYEFEHRYGRHILIKHVIDGIEFYSRYAHLYVMSVRAGDRVRSGEKIGEMGGMASDPFRGVSSGKHLHFEILLPDEPEDRDSFLIKWNGLYTVDPLRWLADTFLHFEAGTGKVKSYDGSNVRSAPSVSGAKVAAYGFGYEFVFIDEKYDASGNLWLRVRDIRELWVCAQYGSSRLVEVERNDEDKFFIGQEPEEETKNHSVLDWIVALEKRVKTLENIAGL
jgi:hypothetical protein